MPLMSRTCVIIIMRQRGRSIGSTKLYLFSMKLCDAQASESNEQCRHVATNSKDILVSMISYLQIWCLRVQFQNMVCAQVFPRDPSKSRLMLIVKMLVISCFRLCVGSEWKAPISSMSRGRVSNAIVDHDCSSHRLGSSSDSRKARYGGDKAKC
jgi:hypothetical protein